MAHQVAQVICRCNGAEESNHLDLSECELMQIPEAVFHLMRNTELKSCDLSSNVIKKIPTKFAAKFSFLTDLNLSRNEMSKLPSELADITSLVHLDISFNSFITLPQVCFKMPNLKTLKANNNAIIEIDTDEMVTSDKLELVDLTNNPLTKATHKQLSQIEVPYRLEISPYQEVEW